jgi:O-antigen/teichoic acid export membrane protein
MTKSPPPLTRRVLAGLAWSVARNWGGRLMSLVTFMVLVRFVGPAEVGLLAAAMVVLHFAELFVEQGFVSAIVQRSQITSGQLTAAFALNLLLASAVFCALVAAAPAIARLMDMPALAAILPWAALILPLHALGFCQLAMYQRQFAYRQIALRALVAQAGAGATAIVLVVQGFGVWALVAQAVLTAGLTTLLLWIGPQWRPSRPFDFSGLRSMFGYSTSILATRVVDFSNQNAVQALLGVSLGAATLGLYSVGVKAQQTLLGLFTAAVMNVAHSGFSRLAADRGRLAAAYRNAVAATALVALPGFCVTALAAPELVVLLFGAQWLPSAGVMVPMALLGAVQSVQFFNGSALNAVGKPSLSLLINAVRFAVTLLALLASWGSALHVIAWSFALSQLLVSPLSYGLARRHVGISLRDTARAIAPAVLACAAMLASAWALRQWPAFASLALPARAALLLGASALACAATYALAARDEVARMRALRKTP